MTATETEKIKIQDQEKSRLKAPPTKTHIELHQ